MLGIAWLSHPTAWIAVDDAVGEGGLYVGVECRAWQHVLKAVVGRIEEGPADTERDHLGELRTRGIVAWPEGAVRVSTNDAVAGEPLYVLVERVAHWYVREDDRAGYRCV